MSLCTRVIPVILWDGKQAVKPKRFSRPARPVGSMMQHLEVMESRNVDELIILDIAAREEGREPLYDEIKRMTEVLMCPLTIGGGISELHHIEKLLKSGADKVTINTNLTAIYFIREAIEKFGSQCIVGSIDYNSQRMFKCHQACEHFIGDLFELYAQRNIKIGEWLITSKLRDGTLEGYDLVTTFQISVATDTPIIINGGCGEPAHMLEAINAGAHAVAASSMFLFTDTTPNECSKYLSEHGVNTRWRPKN